MFDKFIHGGDHIVPIIDAVPTTDKSGIESLKYIGTGVFISKDTFLTCTHVLSHAKSTPCVVSNPLKPNSQIVGLKTEKTIDDLAVAKIREDYSGPFEPLEIEFDSEIILGQEIINYSYTASMLPDHKISCIPRLNRGHIMRCSRGEAPKEWYYLEINFPALRGMSGSPILDSNSGKILGLIYGNYRSQILEDLHQEYEISDDIESISEKTIIYKVVDYAMAIDFSKYKSFLKSSLAD